MLQAIRPLVRSACAVAGTISSAMVDFDPTAPGDAFFADPFPTYQRLRDSDRYHVNPDGSWFLTHYADLLALYRHPRASSDKRALFKPKFGDTPIYEHHTTSLVFNDPPYHTRVRKQIAGALSQRAIRALESDLITAVDHLLDRFEPGTQIDLMAQYAAPIPLEVIGNLFGVPRPDRDQLLDWSVAILGALEATLTQEESDRANGAVEDFLEYLRNLVTDRRRHPLDPEVDLLTRLIVGQDGDRLSEHELLHNLIFILNAGHETTASLIGTGVHSLLEHPDQLTRLRSDPSLLGSAIEEMLRFQSPVQMGNRELTERIELDGTTLPAGAQVWLCIGAANRDPNQFPDPDRFDVGRRSNRHLAFVAGIHTCPGNTLSRMETAVALGRLLDRFPHLRLGDPPTRERRARFRRFSQLPVVL
ncbi:MAG: cytochrome P450 [Pseudomonadota bacterium]